MAFTFCFVATMVTIALVICLKEQQKNAFYAYLSWHYWRVRVKADKLQTASASTPEETPLVSCRWSPLKVMNSASHTSWTHPAGDPRRIDLLSRSLEVWWSSCLFSRQHSTCWSSFLSRTSGKDHPHACILPIWTFFVHFVILRKECFNFKGTILQIIVTLTLFSVFVIWDKSLGGDGNVQKSFAIDNCPLSPRHLRSPTNLLILSLAVSDFLVGFFAMLSGLFLTDPCWYLGESMCAVFCILNVIISSSSVGNMVLISIDRFLAICDPLHYPIRVTMGRTKICICLCWMCSILYNCLILSSFLENPNAYNSCYGECVLAFDNVIGTVDFFCTLIAPVAVIIVLYAMVFSVALIQARAVHVLHAASGSVSVKPHKSEIKAAITLGVVVLIFLICFPPYFFPYLAGQDIKINDSSSSFTVYLLYFNSCLNPVVYALFYPWFRKSVKLILTLKILRTRPC